MDINQKFNSPRPFMRRHPVARFFRIGTMKVNGIQRTMWGFMSFWQGVGRQPLFACFDRVAPTDNQGNLRLEALEEGDIVVEPGLVYKRMPVMAVTNKMMAEHERAMKKFKPKVDIVYEKDTAPAIDAGIIHLNGKDTIQ